MDVAVRTMTAEELLALPDDGSRRELVKGEVRTMAPAGWEHGVVGSRLVARLASYILEHQLGEGALAETGFILSRNPDTVRAPDFAFIRAERLQGSAPIKGYREGAPDLVVEVASPSDSYADLEAKTQEWLDAGASLVWVVVPETRSVIVCRSDKRVVRRVGDALDGEDVVPGFALPVEDIFAGL